MIFIRLLFALLLVSPAGAIILLSFSPSSGMDFYARPLHASLRWWKTLFGDANWLDATLTSALVAMICTLASLSIAVPAVARWRVHPSWLRSATLTLVTLSFVLPPVVLAVTLYIMFVRANLFDNLPGLILAHLAITLPLTVFVLRNRLAGHSVSAYLTARSLGASETRAISTWMLSSHRATLWAAAGTAFMASMSEATLSILLTDTRVRPLPQRIVSSLAQDISPTGYAAMATWMFIVSLAVFLATRPTRKGESQ